MNCKKLKDWSAEKISQRVFYVLIVLSVLVFGLFFLVGYDMPFEENPDFNAPLFTNFLLGLMVFFLFASVVLVIGSVYRTLHLSGKQEAVVNGVPEKKIFRLTWMLTLLLLVITFVIGSSVPMVINGGDYSDWIWLKVSDMFVVSSLVMLVVAFLAVCFGATRYVRKERKA